MTILQLILILTTVLAMLCFIITGLYNALAIRYYTIDTGDDMESVVKKIRIALITDLHSCRYGEDQEILIEAIEKQEPDIVCLSGDIFDDRLPDNNSKEFLAAITQKYPCWYVTGNHEYWGGKSAFDEKMTILDSYGIKRLSGECDTVTINGRTINICGIDDRDAYLLYHEAELGEFKSTPQQLSEAAEQADNGYYTVLLSHRPEYFTFYGDKGFDLVLCGHAHGGQWRIPGILNGLYAPNQGLFPDYAGGRYDRLDNNGTAMTMIVSRGLAKESTRIPRFYNRPEIVIIDLE